MYDMNRPLQLADELIDSIGAETDNAADFLAGIAIAIRRLQGYNDFVLISTNTTLKSMRTSDDR